MELEPTIDTELTVAGQGEAVGADSADAAQVSDALVDDELLVEEISIDGMCGVY